MAESRANVEGCKLYVLDPATELAPIYGVPTCDLEDDAYWPHDAPGAGIQSMSRTQHWEHQHGGGFWLASAMRNSSALTQDASRADIVYVDMHCYHSWFISMARRSEPLDAPRKAIEDVLHALFQTSIYQRGRGSHVAIYLPIPATVSVYSPFTGRELRAVSLLMPERGFLGGAVRDEKIDDREAMLMPYSSTHMINPLAPIRLSDRSHFLYMRAGCSDDPERSAGILERNELIRALKRTNDSDVEAYCTCMMCPGYLDHGGLQQELRKSVFCPVLVGDTQATARLTEVMLAGCIPVFVGAPWHTLPLQDLIDWGRTGIFMNVTNTSSYCLVDEKGRSNMPSWNVNPDIDVSSFVHVIESLDDVLPMLRALPRFKIRAYQKAVAKARPLFWFPPLPTTGRSALGDAVVEHLCAVGKRATFLEQLDEGKIKLEGIELEKKLAAKKHAEAKKSAKDEKAKKEEAKKSARDENTKKEEASAEDVGSANVSNSTTPAAANGTLPSWTTPRSQESASQLLSLSGQKIAGLFGSLVGSKANDTETGEASTGEATLSTESSTNAATAGV